MSDSEFDVIHQENVTTVLRGDDVVGHVIPTHHGYVPFVFHEETGVFEELSAVDSNRRAVLLVQDFYVRRARAA